MRNKIKIRLALFLLAVAIGSAYPVYKIVSYEFPSTPPSVYRFRCGIVDPYDPFRGRYVSLRPLPEEVRLKSDKEFHYNDAVYAVLGTDEKGFAVVLDFVEKPVASADCVKVTYTGRQTIATSSIDPAKLGPPSGNEAGRAEEEAYTFRLPFDRFYMNERLAQLAEKAVQELTREDNDNCVARVKIYKDGNYAIEDLEIKGKPVREYIKDMK